jgi:Rft protein
MLELLSEPLYILAAVQLRFRLRALVDTAAIVAKSATTVALLQLTALPPALALSWAQMAFAAVTLLCYGAAYLQDMPWLAKDARNAADICKAQDGAVGSPQQEYSSQSPATAAAAAVQSAASDGSDLRQRKRVLKQHAPAEATECSHVPATPQEQLLHGPTLWLCSSFALQVSGVLRAVQHAR